MGLSLDFLSCSIDLHFYFFCQYHTVLIIVVLKYSMKSGQLIPPVPFFFLKIVLIIRSHLCFLTNYNFFSSSLKKAIGNLIGIAFNLWIILGSVVIFTTLILPIQEHSISLHLLVSHLISFISVLQFSAYGSFVSLGRFIPRYFTLFCCNGEWDCLLNFSDFWLLVYRNARDFCVLILYPFLVSCDFTIFID